MKARHLIPIITGLIRGPITHPQSSAEDYGDITLAEIGTEVIKRSDLTLIIESHFIFSKNTEADHAWIRKQMEDQIERRLISQEAVNWNLDGEDMTKSRIALALSLKASDMFSRDHVVPYLEIDTASVD